MTLTIHSGNLVALAGRVVNRSGQPVAGVELELWSQEFEYSEPGLVSFSGSSLRSDPEGRFAAPRQFRVDHRYRVKAGGPGLLPTWSDWMRFQPGRTATVPDLVVDRPRPVTGRVVDRNGQPIVGAAIRMVSEYTDRPRTTSGENGSFQVELPPGGVILVFAEAHGFRFQGRLVDPSAGTVELVLTRTGEPVARMSKSSTPSIPAEELRQLALKVLEPETQRLRTGNCGVPEYHTLQRLARIDPGWAMEIAEKAKFVEPMMRDGVKAEAARCLLKESPDEAMALIESLGDATGRVHSYCRAVDLLPASEKDRKRRC